MWKGSDWSLSFRVIQVHNKRMAGGLKVCVRLKISGPVLNWPSLNWKASLKGSWPQCLSIFFRDKSVCACVCLHPCGFSHDFETDIIGVVRNQAAEGLASPQFDCEVSDVAASEQALEKKKINAGVKFNYLKWTGVKTSRSVSNWARFQLTKQPFYLTKCNTTSKAVPLRLRPFQTKQAISS